MCYDAEFQASSSPLSRPANFIVLYVQGEDYRTCGWDGIIRFQKRRLYVLDLPRLRQLISYHGFT